MKLLYAYLGGFIAIVIAFMITAHFMEQDGGLVAVFFGSMVLVIWALVAMGVWALIVTCAYFFYFKKKQVQ